jgi:phosphoglycolate phosphatase-like HAD superfamily hydrolase
VHGIKADEVSYSSYAGRTDGAIARDLLLGAGVEPGRIDAELAQVQTVTRRRYDELCPADLSPLIADGVADLLAEIAGLPERFRLSLLTGNFEPVARLKLARAGIGSYFPPGQGAFGSDAEDRNELPPIARARAGDADGGAPWPRDRTLIIGDTPRDVAAARADGLRCVAVATGPFTVAELAEADFVAADGHEVAEVLRGLE